MQVSLTVPNDPVFAGDAIDLQAGLLEPTTGHLGLTNGLQVVLGE